MAKVSKFGAAFKAARAAGKSTFTFGGKSYNTKMAGEGDAPKPKPRPAAPVPKAKPKNLNDSASTTGRAAGRMAERSVPVAGGEKQVASAPMPKPNPVRASKSEAGQRESTGRVASVQDRIKKAASGESDVAGYSTGGGFKRGGAVKGKGKRYC